MSDVKFKNADKVYYPTMTSRICTLVYSDEYEHLQLEIMQNNESLNVVNAEGKAYRCHNTPSIFHATQENYELLSKLYPAVEFEPPPKRKEPKEVIKAMLDSGWCGVPCWVSNEAETPDSNNALGMIYWVSNSGGYIFEEKKCIWKYATPFDPKTGKTIIDFVDGEVILE